MIKFKERIRCRVKTDDFYQLFSSAIFDFKLQVVLLIQFFVISVAESYDSFDEFFQFSALHPRSDSKTKLKRLNLHLNGEGILYKPFNNRLGLQEALKGIRIQQPH